MDPKNIMWDNGIPWMIAFFDGYLEAYDNCFRGYSDVAGVAYTWVEWLEYNIRRALGKCVDETELTSHSAPRFQ